VLGRALLTFPAQRFVQTFRELAERASRLPEIPILFLQLLFLVLQLLNGSPAPFELVVWILRGHGGARRASTVSKKGADVAGPGCAILMPARCL
jgi:hypothetical protein